MSARTIGQRECSNAVTRRMGVEAAVDSKTRDGRTGRYKIWLVEEVSDACSTIY